jgi:hypothetical protein
MLYNALNARFTLLSRQGRARNLSLQTGLDKLKSAASIRDLSTQRGLVALDEVTRLQRSCSSCVHVSRLCHIRL